MTDSKLHERCVCKIAVNARDILDDGLPLPEGAQIVRIQPNNDGVEYLEDHWLFLRHESLPPVGKSEAVPVRRLIIELIKRDLGPHTAMTQRIARFE